MVGERRVGGGGAAGGPRAVRCAAAGAARAAGRAAAVAAAATLLASQLLTLRVASDLAAPIGGTVSVLYLHVQQVQATLSKYLIMHERKFITFST